MRVFIENEAGAKRKKSYDERTLVLLRTQEVSRAYPYPYGFVLDTRSGDGDAVDCFMLTARGLPSGTIVECEAAGLLEQVEDGEIDHKVLAVLPGETIALAEAEPKLRDFVANVFAHVPGKRMRIGRLLGREEAEAYIQKCKV